VQVAGNLLRVLFITSRLPFPPITGSKTSLFHHIRGLASLAGVTVAAASFVDDPLWKGVLPEFLAFLEPLHPPALGSGLATAIKRSLGGSRWPIQTSIFWARKNARRIASVVERFQPDVVIGHMLRTAPYLLPIARPRVLELEDLLSHRYLRQLETGSFQHLLGEHEHLFPRLLLPIMRIGARRGLLFEAGLVRDAERAWSGKVEVATLVSPLETESLCRETGLNSIFCIPPAIAEPGRLAPVLPTHGNMRLLFTGVFTGHHNVEAAIELCQVIFPHLLTEGYPVTLTIAGRHAKRLRQYATDPRIMLVEDVPDMSAILKEADVFVAPIRSGSGTKLKLIEAMAHGVPIVTTSIGAEGLAGEAGVHYLVSDDVGGLVQSIATLMKDSQRVHAMRQAARSLFEAEYAEGAVAKKLMEVCEFAIQRFAEDRA
jgi:glycosyltransferase involved in cell wall biosynthesis